MKFTVSLSQLKKAVGFLSRVVLGNPILPILENIHCTLNAGTLTLRATDLQTTLLTTCTVESKEEGVFVMPAKKLNELLGTLADQPVNFSINAENYGITIKHEAGKAKIAGENPVDFPKLPDIGKTGAIELDEVSRASFAEAVESTVFACSTDDLRPAMTGIYVHSLDEDLIKLVTTNGHMLATYPFGVAEGVKIPAVIIPSRFGRLILNVNKEAEPEAAMKLFFTASVIKIEVGKYTMIGRLIDERFPDYQNAIPGNNTMVLTVKRDDLMLSLKRVLLTANSNGVVKLSCGEKDGFVLSSENLDYNYESDEMVPAEYEGDRIEIGFNGKLLLNILSHLRTEKLKLSMSAPNRAGIITADGDEHVMYLIMPQLVNSYV